MSQSESDSHAGGSVHGSQTDVPLIRSRRNKTQPLRLIQLAGAESHVELRNSIDSFEKHLRYLGLLRDTYLGQKVSWLCFLAAILASLIPVILLADSKDFDLTSEIVILISRGVLSFIAFLVVPWKQIFVEKRRQQVDKSPGNYTREIKRFVSGLYVVFPATLLMKLATEVFRLVKYHDSSPSIKTIVPLVTFVLFSSYTLGVYIVGCSLFYLVVELQRINFDNFKALLKDESVVDVKIFLSEHLKLVFDMSKISRRFRYFIVSEFVLIVVDQVTFLYLTVENDMVHAIDFLILVLVQLVGMIIFLTAAAKLSNQAQSLYPAVSQWHSDRTTAGESALSFQKRDKFLVVVKKCAGGYTIFRWMIDSSIITAIFSVELSIAFFVLGRAI